MKTILGQRLLLLAALALPVAASAGLAWRAYRENHALRDEIDALRSERMRRRERVAPLATREAALQRDLLDAERARAAAEKAVAEIANAAPPPAAPLATARATDAPARRDEPSGPHGNVYFPELFSDPVYAQHYLAWVRFNNDTRYAQLFGELAGQMPADELARFREALAQRTMSLEEVDGIMTAQAMQEKKPLDRAAMSQAKSLVGRTVFDELQRTFGEAAAEKLRLHENTTPARQDFLDRLNLRLSYSSAPLAPEQIAPLAAAYNKARFSGARGGGGPPDGLSAEFMATAQTILRPEQMPALQEIRAERDASRSGGFGISTRSTTTTRPAVPPPAR